jgi:hypothetical protein
LPGALPVQERVDVPEPPLILAGLSVQDRLVELVVTARDTVPEKVVPEGITNGRELTVIVEVPATPTRT